MRSKTFFFIVCAILLTGCSRTTGTAQNSVLNSEATRVPQADSAASIEESNLVIPATGLLLAADAAAQAAAGRAKSSANPGNDISFSDLELANIGLFSSNASPVLGNITIGGHVINGSGGNTPINAFVTLVIYEKNQIVNEIKIPLDDSGGFVFNLVPWNPEFSYQAFADYHNLEFDSEMLDGGVLLPGAVVQLGVVVYDVSSNAQFLDGVRMRVTYDFTSPGWVQVVESIVISNPTSLVIISPADGSPILDFPLPKSATNVTFPNGNGSDRFRTTADGFGDWQPVMPGNGHQVLVEYSLPFTNSWRHDLSMPIEVDSLVVMVKASRIITSSTGLQLSFTQSNTSGLIKVYTGSNIKTGEKISISFTTEDQVQRMWLGIGIFILTLLIAVAWVIRSNAGRNGVKKLPVVAENGKNVDTILDAIIALDDRFRHGDIAEDAYWRTRGEYVSKLEEMREQPGD